MQAAQTFGSIITSIRDLLNPNPHVNGGNYNLEILLAYGHDEGTDFVEEFRIDAILTPEIFSPYGSKLPGGAPDTSTSFPAALFPDSDH